MCTLAQFASAGWQLWQACELAAESKRRKDEFMAMLAHELRNPLAAIISAHEVVRKISGDDAYILRTDLPEADLLQADLLQAVDIVGRQAHHLSRMVDDLMDLSRIGRGELHKTQQLRSRCCGLSSRRSFFSISACPIWTALNWRVECEARPNALIC